MAKNSRFSSQNVGILGGGQLARMLAESAIRLGQRPIVYSEKVDCPARAYAHEVVSGRLEESAKLRLFISRVPVAIFENEFVDCNRLKEAAQAEGIDSKAFFKPSLSSIEMLQDKLSQKKLLQRLRIPTSRFVEFPRSHLLGVAGFREEILRASRVLGQAIVLKWSRLGYDGKGVHPLNLKERDAASLTRAAEFCHAAARSNIPVFAEAWISFKRELAIIGVAASGGASVTYPLVVSQQEKGVCRWVMGPATALGVASRNQSLAISFARRIAQASGLIGAFGVELFETREGELFVNEIAPRVHNTGHYTQDACEASQFENHMRAVLDLPLHDPLKEKSGLNSIRYFVMLNLLGPENLKFESKNSPLPQPAPQSHLHWYDKTEIQPGRKLGHLNGIARSASGLKKLVNELKASEREWILRLERRPNGRSSLMKGR